MNYREIIVGTKTSAGLVTHIFGATDEFIVFRNEKGEAKVLSCRSDDVYKAACNRSILLSAEGGRKFHGVYQEILDEIGAVCMVQALQKGVKEEDVKGAFEPLETYIRETESIKKLVGTGPEFKHRVFTNHEDNVGWKYFAGNDDDLSNQLAKLDRLSRLMTTQLPRWFRKSGCAAISSSALSVFRTTSTDDRERAIIEAVNHVTRMVREYHHAAYLLILLLVAVLIVLAAMFLPGSAVLSVWQLGIISGTLGAVFSSLQRTKTDSFDLEQSRMNVLVQAVSRVFIGLMAGLFVITASKSGIAFSLIEDNLYATMVVAFAAGFSERKIPDILARIMSDASK